jgi:hypothetical protein
MSQKMRIAKRGNGVDAPSIWVNKEKCQHNGCETLCRPGRGMQLHITRMHGGVFPVSVFDLTTSGSRDVGNTFRNQNIESVSRSDDGLGNAFANDAHWESEGEVESPPLPEEALTKTNIDYYPDAGEFHLKQNSHSLMGN